MATEATRVLIKPLNGANYATWKVQCRMALIREGLWSIVDESEGVPEQNVEKFRLRKDRALATIVLSMEPSLLYLLGPDPDDPAEVWKKLSNQFQKKSWANKLALRRRLYALKLEEGQSIQKHIKSMTELFDELAIVGDPLDDENKVVHLLASLPKSYDMLVTALEASTEVPKIELVTEKLLHEETKRRESSQKDELAMASSHRDKKGLQCYFCRKYGHLKRKCHEYKEWKNKVQKDNEACTAEKGESDDEIIGLYSKQEVVTDWIVDSGASCHMSHDKSLFGQIRKFKEPKMITVGDGFKIKAIGEGVIYLDVKLPGGKVNHCRMSGVLYAPNLSHNLLSVSKMTEAGRKIEFGCTSCKVFGDKRLIAVGGKQGNLYHMSFIQRRKQKYTRNSRTTGGVKSKEYVHGKHIEIQSSVPKSGMVNSIGTEKLKGHNNFLALNARNANEVPKDSGLLVKKVRLEKKAIDWRKRKKGKGLLI